LWGYTLVPVVQMMINCTLCSVYHGVGGGSISKLLGVGP
jgi:hypothetical protein